MPWGLLVVLAAYAVGVVAYVWAVYWDSPRYQAAISYTEALALLGKDDGRSCTERELVNAYEKMLRTASLIPAERSVLEHLEALRFRFEERGFKLRPDLVNSTEMVATKTRRIEIARQPWLVEGAREHGWAADQLLEGPARVVRWSIPGGAFIIVFWAYRQVRLKLQQQAKRVAGQVEVEKQVESLGEFRTGLPPAKPKYPKTHSAKRNTAPKKPSVP